MGLDSDTLLRGKWGITNRDSPQSGGFQRFDQ